MRLKICFVLLFSSYYISSYSQCPEGTVTSEQNLVVNGDFEEGLKDFHSDYTESKYAGGGRYRITDDANKFSSHYFCGKGDGLFMAVDGATGFNKTVWQETIKVKKNTNYFFSCWVSNLNMVGEPSAVLQFSINGILLDKPFRCPKNVNKWEQFCCVWDSNDDEELVIRIVSQNRNGTGNDFGLDRIKFYECQEIGLNIEDNKPIVLRNVLFNNNSAVILESSYAELDKLLDYLTENTTKNIQIAGYTDNKGNDTVNQLLSEKRAHSVMDYLIQKGIDCNRITATGYGENNPIDTNETIEGRQKNRRVEFVIQ